ncbi:HAT dimerization [Artemisia annua]|uniref:HAT dimerization n=1 Tax=Artemisia annua TaxID=35608 RepID=A0A2U1L7T3_ARTAN|nr:HAT dimerization [Artemisia annua]
MCENRKDEDSDDDALELSPTKSQLTENSDVADGCNDQLSERESSLSSNKAGTNSTGRARSQRERKRKVHFDEVSCPLYTSRKVRRFKVMRSLGLAAPVGSPFNSSSMHF